MKVLALNSSPRSESESKTSLMLNALIGGMRSAGAEAEVVHLRDRKIHPCVGCFTCWTKTPGICIHQDDMSRELFPKWLAADLAVYATPLYHFTLNAILKTFIERTLPVAQPFFSREGDRTHHPLRHQPPRAVFLSVAGFPEQGVFDQLASWVHFLFGSPGALVAEIYRPAAEALGISAYRARKEAILEATSQAGREIVTLGAVAEETMARVLQPVTDDPAAYLRIADCMWKTCIAEGVTPREFDARGLVPRPDSLVTFMDIFCLGFDPEAAGRLTADLQFRFSGEVEGACWFRIADGVIAAYPGETDRPSLTIEAPFKVWMDVMTGKADGQQAFMQQQYRVNGDLALLLRLGQIFGGKGA